MPFARRSEGQATVELAIVLPVLILALVGILDVALLVNAEVTVTNASREAATYAVLHPQALPSAIATAASSKSAPLLASQMTVTTTYYDSSAVPPTFRPWPTDGSLPSHSPAVDVPISVEVSYPWSGVTIFLGQLFGTSGRSVTARSTMAVTW